MNGRFWAFAGILLTIPWLTGCSANPVASGGTGDSLLVTVRFPDSSPHQWGFSYLLSFTKEERGDWFGHGYDASFTARGEETVFSIPAPDLDARGTLAITTGASGSATVRLISRDGGMTEVAPEEGWPEGFFRYRLNPEAISYRKPHYLGGSLVTATLDVGAPQQMCEARWVIRLIGETRPQVTLGDLSVDQTSFIEFAGPLNRERITVRMPDLRFVGTLQPVGTTLALSVDDRPRSADTCNVSETCYQFCGYFLLEGPSPFLEEWGTMTAGFGS